MNSRAILLIALVLFACHKKFNGKEDITYKELSSGICTTNVVGQDSAADSPNGFRNIVDNFRLVKETNKIPATMQQQFGVQFVLEAPIDTMISIEQAWIFPHEMTDSKGQKFKEIRHPVEQPTNQVTFAIYSIDYDYEMIKGKWILEMSYDGKLLCQKVYWLK